MASLSTEPLPPDENRGPAILAVTWVFYALSTIFVAARLFTRFRIIGKPGWDDGIMVVAAATNTANAIIATIAVSHGLGRHVMYISEEDLPIILYHSAMLPPLSIAAYCLPKLGVAIFLMKLLAPDNFTKFYLGFILTILFVFNILSAIFFFVQCDPPNHMWHPLEPANCWPPSVLTGMTLFAGSWAAFVDLSLAVYPIPTILKLQMKRKKKITICILISMGIFAMICAIIKTYHLPDQQKPDFTWEFYEPTIWTLLETNIVIVCACVPTLPRFVSFCRGLDEANTGYSGYSGKALINSGRQDYPSAASRDAFSKKQSSAEDSINLVTLGDEARQPTNGSGIIKSVGIEQKWQRV